MLVNMAAVAMIHSTSSYESSFLSENHLSFTLNSVMFSNWTIFGFPDETVSMFNFSHGFKPPLYINVVIFSHKLYHFTVNFRHWIYLYWIYESDQAICKECENFLAVLHTGRQTMVAWLLFWYLSREKRLMRVTW